jgi:hypothetical protein
MNKKIMLLVWLLLLLAACSDGEKSAESAKSAWDDQIKVLDQAQRVDQMVEENAQKQRDEMEKQGL